jgi:hypothetical protein
MEKTPKIFLQPKCIIFLSPTVEIFVSPADSYFYSQFFPSSRGGGGGARDFIWLKVISLKGSIRSIRSIENRKKCKPYSSNLMVPIFSEIKFRVPGSLTKMDHKQ